MAASDIYGGLRGEFEAAFFRRARVVDMGHSASEYLATEIQ